MVPNTKHVVLTKKDKVNIVNRLQKDESGKRLAEEHGVGTFNSLGYVKKRTEWVLKFVSVLASEDCNSAHKNEKKG